VRFLRKREGRKYRAGEGGYEDTTTTEGGALETKDENKRDLPKEEDVKVCLFLPLILKTLAKRN